MSRRNFLTGQSMMASAAAQGTAPQQPAAAKPKPEQPPVIPPMVDGKYGSAEQIMSLPASRLIAILNDRDGSEYAKAKACQRLAVIGGPQAVPALAALLSDPKLSHYARFGLEPNPDSSAGAALLGALDRVQGSLLVGIINSIGNRKDKRAIAALGKLRSHTDLEVARAADAALAKIRPGL